MCEVEMQTEPSLVEPMSVVSDPGSAALRSSSDQLVAGADGLPDGCSGLAVLPFSLLATIKTAQAEHGLRHSDYVRYRFAQQF